MTTDRAAFAGQLSDLPVADLLQTIVDGRHSGLVRFDTELGAATIWFREGQVVDADMGRFHMEDAVRRLMPLQSGTFEVEFKPINRKQLVETETKHLVAEARGKLAAAVTAKAGRTEGGGRKKRAPMSWKPTAGGAARSIPGSDPSETRKTVPAHQPAVADASKKPVDIRDAANRIAAVRRAAQPPPDVSLGEVAEVNEDALTMAPPGSGQPARPFRPPSAAAAPAPVLRDDSWSRPIPTGRPRAAEDEEALTRVARAPSRPPDAGETERTPTVVKTAQAEPSAADSMSAKTRVMQAPRPAPAPAAPQAQAQAPAPSPAPSPARSPTPRPIDDSHFEPPSEATESDAIEAEPRRRGGGRAAPRRNVPFEPERVDKTLMRPAPFPPRPPGPSAAAPAAATASSPARKAEPLQAEDLPMRFSKPPAPEPIRGPGNPAMPARSGGMLDPESMPDSGPIDVEAYPRTLAPGSPIPSPLTDPPSSPGIPSKTIAPLGGASASRSGAAAAPGIPSKTIMPLGGAGDSRSGGDPRSAGDPRSSGSAASSRSWSKDALADRIGGVANLVAEPGTDEPAPGFHRSRGTVELAAIETDEFEARSGRTVVSKPIVYESGTQDAVLAPNADPRRISDEFDVARHSPATTPHASVGRYEVLLRLARGGMGTVYLARVTGEGGFRRLFALKVVRDHLSANPEYVRMLLREARIASRLHHPNVVSIVDIGTLANQHYLVMDYVEGCTFSELLKFHRQRRPPELIVPIVLDALTGLHAAHSLTDDDGRSLTLVHCDFSPQNMLVGADGTCRISDFGIARAADVLGDRSGVTRGKPGYLSPEQVMGRAIDHRSDVFSAGVVLWTALTGEPLFDGGTPEETLNNVLSAPVPAPSTVGMRPPPCFDAVVLRALERDPNRRYQTAEDMLVDLRKVAIGADLLAPPTSVAQWVFETFGRQIELRRQAAGLLPTSGASPMANSGPVRSDMALVPVGGGGHGQGLGDGSDTASDTASASRTAIIRAEPRGDEALGRKVKSALFVMSAVATAAAIAIFVVHPEWLSGGLVGDDGTFIDPTPPPVPPDVDKDPKDGKGKDGKGKDGKDPTKDGKDPTKDGTPDPTTDPTKDPAVADSAGDVPPDVDPSELPAAEGGADDAGQDPAPDPKDSKKPPKKKDPRPRKKDPRPKKKDPKPKKKDPKPKKDPPKDEPKSDPPKDEPKKDPPKDDPKKDEPKKDPPKKDPPKDDPAPPPPDLNKIFDPLG